MIGDRWGVTDSEMLRCYPCDDFIVSPALRAWRCVHVEASADVVGPWVAQVRRATRCDARLAADACIERSPSRA